MRYVRVGQIVYVKWCDKRVVTVLPTMHSALSSVEVLRWVKVNITFVQQPFRRPATIDSQNKFMGGVNVFDQLAPSYRILRRSKKFTNVIVYYLVEVATIYAFL